MVRVRVRVRGRVRVRVRCTYDFTAEITQPEPPIAAFPLAPLCAFMNNVTEIRFDAIKLCSNNSRLGLQLWQG